MGYLSREHARPADGGGVGLRGAGRRGPRQEAQVPSAVVSPMLLLIRSRALVSVFRIV